MAALRARENERLSSQIPTNSLKGMRLREQLLVQNAQPNAIAESFDSAQLNHVAPTNNLTVAPSPSRQEIIGNRDRFEAAPVNPFQQTKQEPVSTFSIDVDTASYSFVRRTLRGGQLPPPEAVRIEEMVNYFDYSYSTPSDPATPFEPTVAVYPSPWNQGTQILHVGIKGYEVPVAEKPRSNLTFLIDTSGSMTSADKLPLLQQSLRMMVEQLNPDDTVAIVAYAGNAGTVLEPTPISERSQILRAIDRLAAGGSTAGGEGIRLAYKLARQNFDDDAVNQVIIGTDGDFNVGITDPNALQDYIEAERASGVFLSVLGFGQGNYNDALMQRLAQNGNGFAAYIDTADEARKVLVDELTSTLVPIAKDVKIQIEFNPNQVSEYRLVGYESRMLAREDFDDDRVDAGEIGAGHTVTALYEIVPVGALVAERGQQESLRYADAYSTANILQQRAEPEPAELSEALSGELGFLKLRYKLPNEDTSRLITRPIQSDEAQSIESTGQDVQFAAAVAGFAQLLRRSSAVERGFDYGDVERLARRSEGADRSGRRAEFLSLVQRAAELSNQGRYR
ncbi:MAG: VWA domain-containing protein [Alphaproteobacteria bacterium]|nr:VWA domain-containing protein [Alphaproteobacteria bacterium SS10]